MTVDPATAVGVAVDQNRSDTWSHPVRPVLCAIGVLTLTVACGGTSVSYAELEAVSIAGASGKVLDVTVYHGACDDVLPTEVVETPTQVRLRVPVRVDDADCTDIGRVLVSTVNLQQPLGDRSVIDVEAQRPLPIREG